jgi:FtsP/CotA-like multicopper oxidase with cupredoxin domain
MKLLLILLILVLSTGLFAASGPATAPATQPQTIENHTSEEHAFHIHQLHYLLMAVNGVAVANPTLQDTYSVPFWNGKGPFSSITVRMDFRDPNIAGTFVYHCHVLDHEDAGMMAKIQVNP